MAILYVHAKVNSTDYGDVGSGTVTNSFLRLISFGAYASDTAAFDIRDIKVGTSGYGSSDLFAPVLNDLTEFDGVFGNDGSIVASSGVLSVDAASGDHYGWKDFGANQTDVYVQFQLRTRAGNNEPDVVDVWDDSTAASGDGTAVDGLFTDPAGSWGLNGPGNHFGSGPSGDPTWDTVNLRFSFSFPNTTQDGAIDLSSTFCSEATITNAGASDTLAADDPLNTVYSLGGTFSRQVWYKLTNTSGAQAYARFTFTNLGDGHDIAAALYLDDPAATQIVSVRTSDATSFWDTPMADGTKLGVALEPGQTVWLEVAGDDTEGDGQGWNGNLTLEWQLLTATFYDTPDSFTGTTEFVSGFTDGIVDGPEPVSYAKMGDLHFAALNDGGATDHFLVAVWTEGGGTPTIYTISIALIGRAFIPGSIDKPYGPAAPQIRTDGTNLWVVAYMLNDNTETCGGVSHNAFQWTPAVFVWNGSGFDYIGSAPVETFPWSGGYLQQIGMISAAASSEEAGVLHVMWSESGVSNIDSVTCDILGFGSFVHYTKWSTSGLVSSGDSLSSGALGSSPSSLVPYTSSYLFVTNAFGSPVAFYGYPVTLGLTTGSQAGNITYGDLIEMWSINESTGAKTLLQSAHGTSLLGATATLDETSFQITAGGTRQPPQDTFGGVDTIFFQFPFTTTGSNAPLLNVPADGSSAIVVTTPAVGAGGVEDVYDDSRNIWTGGNFIHGASLTCSGGLSNLDTSADNIFVDGGDAGRLELYYDATADAFYTLGFEVESPAYQIAPVKVPILRDYLICSVGDCVVVSGRNIWQRI